MVTHVPSGFFLMFFVFILPQLFALKYQFILYISLVGNNSGYIYTLRDVGSLKNNTKFINDLINLEQKVSETPFQRKKKELSKKNMGKRR